MTAARGKGHLPSPYDARDFPIGALIQQLAATTPLPESDSLQKYVGPIVDQGGLSCCVACASTKAIVVRSRFLGQDVPELSPLAGYVLTRGMSRVGDEPLVDTGSIPRAFFQSAAAFGVVAETRWPLIPERVNDMLPLDIFEAGIEARVAAYHGVQEVGWTRCDLIRNCIHGGTPVAFAMPVDDSYEKLSDDSVYQGRVGDSKGGHYQLIVGYKPDAFLVLGSWGIGFGAGGYAWIAADYIADPVEVTDLFAVDTFGGLVT